MRLDPIRALRFATRAERAELVRMLRRRDFANAGVFLTFLCTRTNRQRWLGVWRPSYD